MPRTIWNEGRVVGLSAYEIFVRHVLTKNPQATVPTELEWLTSMMVCGNSMLLQVGADDIHGVHYIEVDFPETSNLWANNTIVGSFFYGTGYASTTSDAWCTKVIDYGPLLNNNADSSPNQGGTSLPPSATGVEFSETTKARLAEYGKILDGIVIQPGWWTDNSDAPPQKNHKPDATYAPKIRIMVKDKITTPFYILLTGFSYRAILDSIYDYDDPTVSAVDGTFLGPQEFPWASKIIFSVPSALTTPAVGVDVSDLADLYLCNTKYLWPYCHHSDGGAPTQDDLKNVKTLNGVQVVNGYVSQYFIDNYCVSYYDAIAAASMLSDIEHPDQQVYIDQIVDKYGTAKAQSGFSYFFESRYSSHTSKNSQGVFWVVDNTTKRIVMTLSSSTVNSVKINATRGFNFTGNDITVSDVTIKPASENIMGTYWGGGVSGISYDSNTETITMKDSNNTTIFSGHPIQKNAVADYDIFYRPTAGTPLPPSSYGDNFLLWFSTTSIRKVLGLANADNILDSMNIHTDYRNLSAQEFFQYAATGRDMTKSIDTDYTDDYTTNRYYIYSKSDIEALAEASSFPSGGVSASAVFEAQFSMADFFKPCKLRTYLWNGTTKTDEITAAVVSPTFHMYSADTSVDREGIQAVSLTDDAGAPLPLHGISGTITGDMLTWEMLLAALGQNKSVDLLGTVLTGLKGNLSGSSSNYIQFGNGLRLYVSSTAPTPASGDTIPEGSVGLGWGGVKIYTSGAWT